ncbi:MAG: alanine--tRNA ligase [Bacilli bacterium]|nr:alanine--tRNA ligase [Bacilli bacterium]MDD4795387.1 alanine--tRNA ligase [Bacilli bacterium]
MNLKDLYINFFIEKGHKEIPSAPVVPENDPSVLFNTAGMQPLIPYLMGKVHPYGKRLVNAQKCIRTNDLDVIGDATHHTFFEMLGNWSLGDYFKEESISYSYEFLTKVLKIPHKKLAVTVFIGNAEIPRDEVSANLWRKQGIPDEKIAYLGIEDNFWIAGDSGPCGADTEIFYWRSNEEVPHLFDPEDNRWVEIWNNVFMEFHKSPDGKIKELEKKNVDTGMGYERVVAVLEGKDDNYLSSLWINSIKKLEEITGLSYEGHEKEMRIIADHIRTAVFILSDYAGIKPANTDQGYILRRLIRRAIRHSRTLNIDQNSNWEEELAKIIIDQYSNYYKELEVNKETILTELAKEKTRFSKTLEKGLKEFAKVISNLEATTKKEIGGKAAFKLYDTYGFPIELTEELAKEKGFTVDLEGFKQKYLEHQEKSREGASGKFKGGLAGDTETETRLHTATHLLNAALKEVVDKDIHQKGSNINSERLRFDFNSDRKITSEELIKIEELVNSWINESHDVEIIEMNKEEALKTGAECMFIDKYPDVVQVYKIGNISSELCGGPHVKNTKEIGIFKIIKEEASSAGIRRIKATIS